MTTHLADRITQLKSSPIRDLLSLIDRPGMISFAGGLPAPETFAPLTTSDIPLTAQQYGATEGEWALRERVALLCDERGLSVTPNQVLILNGSQQGLDLVAKLLLQSGRRIALEDPCYLAALQVFRLFGAECVPLNCAAEVSYIIPNFQNPSARTWTLVERQQFAYTAEENRQIVIEDDAYHDLCYDGTARPPVVSMLHNTDWVYLSSFSKSLCPGLRLGFLVASPGLMPYLVRLKQAADLCSNRLSQYLVLSALNATSRKTNIAHLRDYYRQKRAHFQSVLLTHFSSMATWQLPLGGMFFWLSLKDKIDTRTLLPLALNESVAFMPGEHFFLEPEANPGYLRLNFSHATAPQVEQGLTTLARIIQQATLK